MMREPSGPARAMTSPPHRPSRAAWQDLPSPVALAAAGIGATALLVALAASLRGPIDGAATGSPAGALSSADAGSPPAAPSGGERGPSAGQADASATAGPVLPETAREALAGLRKQLQRGQYTDAVASLDRLLALDAAAASDRDVRDVIVDLSMRVMMMGEGPTPDRMFALITDRMGPTGADILYELFTTRGGSRAAKRAEELLRDASVRARGTPALRIAYDLRAARCSQKPPLFDRAKTEGDSRTLGQLELLLRDCDRDEQECCLPNDPDVKAAITAVKTRLK